MAMSATSSIEWTEATWNPVTGCTKVSPGCDHCYAETFAERFRGTPGHHFERGFDVQLRPEKLDLPLLWRKPRRIFVNSMSDLFHADVPDEFIARVFAVMALAPQHTFQLLTKRHARMRSLLSSADFREDVQNAIAWFENPQEVSLMTRPRWPLANLWLGVSVEDQQWADIRIPALLETPAAVRWVSAEPLLGSVDLRLLDVIDVCNCGGGSGEIGYAHESGCGIEPGKHWGLSWVVVGGESGPGARPMHPQWARDIRDECASAGVPFLFKQWGAHDEDGRRVGKGKAGRLLDGVQHDGYPGVLEPA